MPKPIDSSALDLVNRTLGMAGGSSVQQTFLEDGVVSQTFDIMASAGRALSYIPESIAVAQLETTQTAAGTVATSVDPYLLGTNSVATIWNWPDPVPAGVDVWFLGCCMQAEVATDFVTGLLDIVGDQAGDGAWGESDGAAAPQAITFRFPVGAWNSIVAYGGISYGVNTQDAGHQLCSMRPPFRIRRGMSLDFRTTTNGVGPTELQALVMLGIFPVGAGRNAST